MAQWLRTCLPMQEMQFDPWGQGVEYPLEEETQPIPIFLPGKSYELRSLAGHCPWDRKRVGYDQGTKQRQQQCSFFKIYTFIYFWLHWVFVAVQGLSLVAASRGYSLGVVHRLFPLWELLLLWSTGSRTLGLP